MRYRFVTTLRVESEDDDDQTRTLFVGSRRTLFVGSRSGGIKHIQRVMNALYCAAQKTVDARAAQEAQ